MGFFSTDFNRPGPGIEKNAPKKKGVALFFDIYTRVFWELLKLNMLYLLFCIPIVTIGPATAAMNKITMMMIREQPFFLFSDFMKAFKQNFKQSLLTGLVMTGLAVLLPVTIRFYFLGAPENNLFYVGACISIVLGFVILMSSIYVYPMIVTMDLPLMRIYQNSVLLSVACLKYTLPVILILGIFAVALFLYIPVTIPILLVWFFSFAAFVSSFAAWPCMVRYVIAKDQAESQPS